MHPTQRLIFFRVAGLPLFWRVALEILSADHDPEAVHPPGSFQSSETWSATHSALMCAVAAIKAFLRHRPDEGAHLVSKGFERIHIPVPTVPPRRQILALILSTMPMTRMHRWPHRCGSSIRTLSRKPAAPAAIRRSGEVPPCS